ncbi:methylosome protein WDR77-like [Lycorma delicatula]|uniref:methylosome protein WDR77-like n=1 Tax=Lycorma delicatula TaxID=130591 RepID=UPI003F513445
MNGELCDVITEPNRMSEIYRRFQPAPVPLQIEKHLTFVDISDDGCMLLGSNTLNGRYWTGTLHFFNEATVTISKNTSLSGMNCQSVVTEGKFVSSRDKVIIGEDSGSLSLLKLTDVDNEGVKSTHVLANVVTYDHDSAVLSLSVSPDKNTFVSGSMDKCIKVWDVEGLVTHYTFRPAHIHHVTSVEYSSNSNSIFASCSLDGFALMWDTRLDKPATVVRHGNGEGLTSLSWYPLDDNILAIGSNFGLISLYDIRALSPLTMVKCFDRPLHRLTFNSIGILAACGDTHEVKMLESKPDHSLITIYSSEEHNYFVRGLSWHPLRSYQLYSCGLDEQLLCHTINDDAISS